MICLEDFTKEYKGFDLQLSMQVKPGTVCGIIGKNGAGKSTTIKAILGLIYPTSGSVTVLGKNPGAFTAKDKSAIGACLADSGFSHQLTINDVICILRRMFPEFDEEVFRRQCKQQRMPFDKAIGEFSTGMKAKLRVLTALCHHAKLLVLDEPTTGLDVTARNAILDMLRAYMAEDEERSMLISSHISTDLEGLCDEVYMIDEGRLVLHEDTDVLLGSYGVLKLTPADYEKLDKTYILNTSKRPYGYDCLTNKKQFYLEKDPALAIENGSIDSVITLMMGYERDASEESSES